MTKLITVYKRFLSSKLKLQEYDEDLYPEDHQVYAFIYIYIYIIYIALYVEYVFIYPRL